MLKRSSILGAALAAIAPQALSRAYIGAARDHVNEAEGLGDNLRNIILRGAALSKGFQPNVWSGAVGQDPFSAAVIRNGNLPPSMLKYPALLKNLIVTAPKGDPAITAHELGHVSQPDWINTGYMAGGVLPLPLAMLAAGLKSKGLAGASALSAVPRIINETDASRRGSNYLKMLGDPDPWQSYVGLPTYVMSGLGPAAIALASRKFKV